VYKKLILLLFFLSGHLFAAPNYSVENFTGIQAITHYWQLIPDKKSTALTPNELVLLSNEAWLKKSTRVFEVPKQGNWYYFKLKNSGDKQKSIYLSIDNHPLLTQSQLYTVNDQVVEQQKLLLLNNNSYINYLTINPQTELRVLLYLKAQGNINISVKIYQPKAFVEEKNTYQLSAGIAIGGMICFALIELVWFFASGLKTALLLTGYFISRALLLAALLGWNINYLLPDMSMLTVQEMIVLASLSTVFFLWFIIDLFNLVVRHPRLAQLISYFCWFNLLYIPASFFFSIKYNLTIVLLLHVFQSILLLSCAYIVIQNKARLGHLLAIIASLQLMFTLLVITSSFGVGIILLPWRDAIYYSAFWLNSLLITFLLSRHYYYESKEIAQRQALESAVNSKNAQQKLIALQNETQELLEQHVQERTLELNIALQELEAANQELARKNTLDELTGLHNRRYYDQKIAAEFRRSKRNLLPLSIVLIDIDHFKHINDTYGHQAGDYCLQKLGHILKASLRRSADVGCRYGGEEFCLILPDTDTMGAIEFAENLRLKISQTQFEYKDIQLNITISCGISTYQQQDNATPETLFAAADKALYLAKNHGRNQTWQYAIEDL
jgi:diguanylate cyclase (GGDEF)-like protein